MTAVSRIASEETVMGTATRRSEKSRANNKVPGGEPEELAKSSDGIVAMGRSGGIDGRHADDIVPGRNESAEEESLLRRRFRTGDDPFGGIGRAESDDELLDRTSAVPPPRPSQFQNGRRAGQLIGFFFFIRREEFRRRSFGFGRHQIAGRAVAHSVAGGRQREFVLAAAVQVADWDGPPSGRKDSLSPFVLLGRPTGPEFEDERSDGRDLFRRQVVLAAGHGPLECDGREVGCGEAEVRGRREDDDGQQIGDPILSVSVFGLAAVISSGVSSARRPKDSDPLASTSSG